MPDGSDGYGHDNSDNQVNGVDDYIGNDDDDVEDNADSNDDNKLC